MKTKPLLVVGMMLVALFTFSACGDDSESSGSGEPGRVTLTLQDAPGDIQKLMVTIDEVAIHYVPADDVDDDSPDGDYEDGDEDHDDGRDDSPDGDENDDDDGPHHAGWYTVLDDDVTFDLIQLKDNPTELGYEDFPAGKITQIRLILADDPGPSVTIDDVEHALTVPSGTIKLVNEFTIRAGEETVIRLDFDAEKSVHSTGAGDYMLQPTVKVLED